MLAVSPSQRARLSAKPEGFLATLGISICPTSCGEVWRKAVLVHRMQRRIEQLGFEVTLQPVAAPAA